MSGKHVCTDCHTVHDSAKDVVDGCDGCGGGTFEYVSDSTIEKASQSDATTEDVPDPTGRPWPDTATPDEGESGTTDSSVTSPASTQPDDDVEVGSEMVYRESAVDPAVDSDDGSEEDAAADTDDIIIADSVTDRERVRSKLNEELSSIRIVEEGRFKLNLRGLFEKEDHIITLGEDGRYSVQSISTWSPDDLRDV